MASNFDEKCREKEKGVLNRRKPVLNPTTQHVTVKLYSRLTGFDALLIDRVVYYKFKVILWFLCTRKYLDTSSLKHVVFKQK